MATNNLTTADDGANANRLFEAMAILQGLEAFAHQEEDGSGVCTSLLHMSRTARQIIDDVTAAINP